MKQLKDPDEPIERLFMRVAWTTATFRPAIVFGRPTGALVSRRVERARPYG